MSDKLVFSCRAAGCYVGLLGDGYSYGGSRIVRAGSLKELEAKAENASRCDALRWVTINGAHVLIEDKHNYIVAGAGGRLNGQRFGYRFTYGKEEKEPFREARGFSPRRRRTARNKYNTLSGAAADRRFRARSGKVWREADDRTKKALYSFTYGGKWGYNDLLRDSALIYASSSNLAKAIKKNTNWQRKLSAVKAIEKAVAKSKLKGSTVVSRKMSLYEAAKFLGVPKELLAKGSEAELRRELIGAVRVEHGFCDTTARKGASKERGMVEFEIFVPKGTEALYVEPFAAKGRGGRLFWDGKSRQESFGEQRLLLQRGTQQGVTGLEKDERGNIKVCVDVIGYEQLYLPPIPEARE